MYDLYFLDKTNRQEFVGSGDMEYVTETVKKRIEQDNAKGKKRTLFKVINNDITYNPRRGEEEMGKNIRYLTEEIELVKNMYVNNYSIRNIPTALNEKFHNGEPVRTYCGVKDLIKRYGFSAFRPSRKSGEMYFCKACGKYKYKVDFGTREDCVDGVSSICKRCVNAKARQKNMEERQKYKKRLGVVKVVCQNCFKHIGTIPIVEDGAEGKRILEPNCNINILLDENGELGTAHCVCGKNIDLNEYYRKWFE